MVGALSLRLPLPLIDLLPAFAAELDRALVLDVVDDQIRYVEVLDRADVKSIIATLADRVRRVSRIAQMAPASASLPPDGVQMMTLRKGT